MSTSEPPYTELPTTIVTPTVEMVAPAVQHAVQQPDGLFVEIDIPQKRPQPTRCFGTTRLMIA